jgi:hypothetical protein
LKTSHIFLSGSYSSISAIASQSISHTADDGGVTIKKTRTEEEYFNADSDSDGDKEGHLPYQPAPGSPSRKDEGKKEDSEEEVDPLDAFMAEMEKSAKKDGLKSRKAEAKAAATAATAATTTSKSKTAEKDKSNKGMRLDIDEADNEETYYKWLADNPNAGRSKTLLCLKILSDKI